MQHTENGKMADVNTTLSVITINVTRLRKPVSREKIARLLINTHDPTIFCLEEIL